jgi:hypothetical protein
MKWFKTFSVRNAMAITLLVIGVAQVVSLWHVPLSGLAFVRAMLGFTNILVSLGLQGSSRLPYLMGSMSLTTTLIIDLAWFTSDTAFVLLGLYVVLTSLITLVGLGLLDTLRYWNTRSEQSDPFKNARVLIKAVLAAIHRYWQLMRQRAAAVRGFLAPSLRRLSATLRRFYSRLRRKKTCPDIQN